MRKIAELFHIVLQTVFIKYVTCDVDFLGPKIIEESSGLIYESHSATFGWKASGREPLTYTLKKDGEAVIPDGPDGKYDVTNCTIVIREPYTKEDSGKYSCWVSNSFGTIFSLPVEVLVDNIYLESKPGIIASVNPVDEHDHFVLGCYPRVDSHFPRPMIVKWLHNGQYIEPEEDPYFYISYRSKLYNSAARRSDAGTYQCEAQLRHYSWSLIGEQQRNTKKRSDPINITVRPSDKKHKPVVQSLEDFPNTIANVDETLTLECIAAGSLPLTYKWDKTDGPMASPPRANYSAFGRLVEISNVTLGDEGRYTCDVSGTEGSSYAMAVNVSIRAKPTFTDATSLQDSVAVSGEALQLRCEPYAYTDYKPMHTEIKWYKNGQEFRSYAEYHVGYSVAYLNEPTVDDSGMYQCVVSAITGKATSIMELKVIQNVPAPTTSPSNASSSFVKYTTSGVYFLVIFSSRF